MMKELMKIVFRDFITSSSVTGPEIITISPLDISQPVGHNFEFNVLGYI
jgi:hypothetical protein